MRILFRSCKDVTQENTIDKQDEAMLARGDVADKVAYDAENQVPEGLVVRRKTDGQRLFFSARYMEVQRRRNRGRNT